MIGDGIGDEQKSMEEQPFATKLIVTGDASASGSQSHAPSRWEDAEPILRDALRSRGRVVRLVGGVRPGLPRTMTISGCPDDLASAQPVHPNDVYRSVELRAGRHCVSVEYDDGETAAFRLRDVSLAVAVEVARVFYAVGGVHEEFDWEEAEPR
jgi:hypothetical protein